MSFLCVYIKIRKSIAFYCHEMRYQDILKYLEKNQVFISTKRKETKSQKHDAKEKQSEVSQVTCYDRITMIGVKFLNPTHLESGEPMGAFVALTPTLSEVE